MTGETMIGKPVFKDLDRRLWKIAKHLPVILEGALRSQKDIGNPLRHANTANALRELLREIFESLAPDKEIKKCFWFVPDRSSKNGVTRRDRIKFAIYGYVGAGPFPKKFVQRAEDLAKRILSQISRLQALTHVNAASLAVAQETADLLFMSTLRSYFRLLGLIDDAKIAFESELATILSVKLDEKFNDEINDFEFATHARPEYTEDVTVGVDDINAKEIHFSGRGSILYEIQYGRTETWIEVMA
jgi:hypothetical protein